MSRPPLPGTVWVHARVKLTPDEYDAFKAVGTRERQTDAAVITAAVRTLIAKVSPDAIKAYRALRGPAPKAKAKTSPPPPSKAKPSK
jgi:hypothetical protein